MDGVADNDEELHSGHGPVESNVQWNPDDVDGVADNDEELHGEQGPAEAMEPWNPDDVDDDDGAPTTKPAVVSSTEHLLLIRGDDAGGDRQRVDNSVKGQSIEMEPVHRQGEDNSLKGRNVEREPNHSPIHEVANPLRSAGRSERERKKVASGGTAVSHREPQRSRTLKSVGHGRTVKGVHQDHIRVDDYGPISIDGTTFGTELCYVDIRSEKIVLRDKGWGLDPFDQAHPDVLWIHAGANVFSHYKFMVHFLEHLFLPFSVPFMAYFKGVWYIRIQGLTLPPDKESGGWTGFDFLHNYVFPFAFWIMIFSALPNTDKFCHNNINSSDIVTTFFAIAVHRAAVSLKYASLSEEEYTRFWETRDLEKSQEWKDEMQMITGFYCMRPKLCEWEVLAAAKRSGLKYEVIQGHKLIVRNIEEQNLDQWRGLLGQDPCLFETPEAESKLHFPNAEERDQGIAFEVEVTKVVRALVGYARDEATIPYNGTICFVVGFAFASLPLVMRATCKGDNIMCIPPGTAEDDLQDCGMVMEKLGWAGTTFGASGAAVTYVISSFVVRFEYSGINFLFLSMSIVDNLRTLAIFSKLGDLIRPLFSMAEKSPQLTWCKSNIKYWTQMRILLLEFGGRTKARIEVLYKIHTAMMIYVVLGAVVGFLYSADDLKRMKYMEILWYAFFQVGLWTLVTLSRLFICVHIKDELNRHGVYLARLLNVADAISDKDTRTEYVEEVHKSIMSVQAVSDSMTYSVLGIEGTSANAYTLLTYVITGVTIVITAVYGIQFTSNTFT